jgi:hypothetical protein
MRGEYKNWRAASVAAWSNTPGGSDAITFTSRTVPSAFTK